MIKIKELRLGNRIAIEGEIEIVEVTSLCDDGEIGTTAYFDGLKGCNDCTADGAIPILLTSEILEACGFKKGKVQSGGFYGYDNGKMELDNNFQFEVFDGRIEENTTRTYRPELKYLHQLQNLYFTLTGEELKCNL